MALGVIEGLWDQGLTVPKDVAIVSYDDIGFGKDFRPRLTTVHQPRDRLAVAASARLGELLARSRDGNDGERLQRRVQPYLVVRESCGAERREGAVAAAVSQARDENASAREMRND
jgi:DNA-binding LacI/PurR family transcriptional regulator